MSARHASEQRTQHHAADDRDRRDRRQRRPHCSGETGGAGAIGGWIDGAEGKQDRHHGQILKQQDGEAGPAGGCVELLFLR